MRNIIYDITGIKKEADKYVSMATSTTSANGRPTAKPLHTSTVSDANVPQSSDDVNNKNDIKLSRYTDRNGLKLVIK